MKTPGSSTHRFVGLDKATLLFALIASLSLTALSGCNKHDDQAAASQEMPPTAVTAADAIARDVPIYLDEIGSCVSPEVVTIMPQVAGRITQIHFVEGADVKKGDLLFTIDARPYQAVLAKTEAELAQDRATMEKMKLDFRRVKELQGTNAISQDEFDQKRLAADVSQAQLDAAQAQVDMAKLDLEYCTIKSPIDGRSGKRLVDVGNVVKANEGALLVIQRLNPIYAEFTVTDNDLGTVRSFMEKGSLPKTTKLKVEVDLPADSSQIIAALGGAPTSRPAATGPSGAATTSPATAPTFGPRIGDLTFLDNAVENSTGTIKARATLDNPDRYFWPGQFVRVRVVLTIKKDAVLVPVQAQQIGQQGPFVFVVKPDNTVEMRAITPGQRQGDLLIVEHGLSAGEKVVVTGQLMLAPGGKVQVVNAVAPPQGDHPSTAPSDGSHS